MELSHQLAKDSFGPITSDRIAESLPHNDPHAARGIVHPARQEIEEVGRHAAAMMLDELNIPAAAQKNAVSSSSLGCHSNGVFLRRILHVHNPGEDTSW